MRRAALAAVVALFLSACVNYNRVPYGEIDDDSQSVFADGGKAITAPNVPTISQGYQPAPEERATREPQIRHEGIDIVAAVGTPILSAAPGIVESAFFEPMYGNQVAIRHDLADGEGSYRTRYLHLDSRLVEAGQSVSRGQPIGGLGQTGLLAAHPHLHFEVRYGRGAGAWPPRNPHQYWADGVGLVTCFNVDRDYSATSFTTTFPLPCKGVPWQ